jgi:DNA repair protein RecN (Recombination protein N)
MGQAHLLVHKEVINNRTYTRMRPIKGEDRIIEIAKMLSGDPPPESAKENAKALLQNGLLTKDN